MADRGARQTRGADSALSEAAELIEAGGQKSVPIASRLTLSY